MLVNNLPSFLRKRFSVLTHYNWIHYFRKHWVMVILSMLVGIFSHLLWDAFTHLNLRYPDATYSQVRFLGHRLYLLLQYSNSLIGLAVVIGYIARMPQHQLIKVRRSPFAYWLLVGIFGTITGAIIANNTTDYIDIIFYINTCISSALLGLTLTSLLFKYG